MVFPYRELKLSKHFICLTTILFLSPGLVSCAINRTAEKDPSRHLLFELNGRILASRANETSFSASFNWRQYIDSFEMVFWGPLGQGKTSLIGGRERVTLTTPSGGKRVFTNYQQWMENELGFSLPISFVAAWIRGRPFEEHPHNAVLLNTRGEIIRFQQLGWQIELSRSPENGATTRVVMEKGGDLLTILCGSWLELAESLH